MIAVLLLAVLVWALVWFALFRLPEIEERHYSATWRERYEARLRADHPGGTE